MKYENREISLRFEPLVSWGQLEQLKSRLANELHGKLMRVVFDVDDSYFYYGRCHITKFNTDKYPAEIEITLDAEPYKYNIIKTILEQTVSGTGTIVVPDQKMKVVPVINVSADMELTHLGAMHQLYTGDNTVASVVLSSGDNNRLSFSGTGTVRITFRGGEL